MTDALVTSTDSSVVIEVAEFVLNHGVTSDAVRCLPTDVEGQGGSDGFTSAASKEDSTFGGSGSGRVVSDLIEMLLVEACKVENHLAETGHVLLPTFGYSTGMRRGQDGHIKGCVGAGIYHDGRLTAVLNLDRPVVDQIVSGCSERSLTDRIRIFSQLVRIFYEAVGFVRDIEAFSSGFVCNFSLAVCTLREAVRAYRDYEATETAKHSDGSEQN